MPQLRENQGFASLRLPLSSPGGYVGYAGWPHTKLFTVGHVPGAPGGLGLCQEGAVGFSSPMTCRPALSCRGHGGQAPGAADPGLPARGAGP